MSGGNKNGKGGKPLSEYLGHKPDVQRKIEEERFAKMRDLGKRQKTARDIMGAEMAARGMRPSRTTKAYERRKDEAVKEFFGEAGIPPGLQQGWAIYEQRREVREKVGAPMPPGGCLLLGREAVLAGVIAEAHMKLAAALRIDPKAIRMGLNRDEKTRGVSLVCEVNPPDDWVIPVPGSIHTDPKEVAKAYIQTMLMQINGWFRAEVNKRLEASEKIRPELNQKVPPMTVPPDSTPFVGKEQ